MRTSLVSLAFPFGPTFSQAQENAGALAIEAAQQATQQALAHTNRANQEANEQMLREMASISGNSVENTGPSSP